MPKHNPKLEKNGNKKKDSTNKKEEESYEYERSYAHIYMAVIFVGIIIIIVVLFINVFNPSIERVEQYDKVKLDYKIYTLEQYDDHEDPEIKKTNTWVNACSRYDDDCDKGLIEGFYQELLGKKEDDVAEKSFKACIDKDKDGEDDNTGDEALSYGFSNDDLYDTDIVVWFKVIQINKSQTASVKFGVYKDNPDFSNQDRGILENFNYIFDFSKKEIILQARQNVVKFYQN